jgi:hypothetical protein
LQLADAFVFLTNDSPNPANHIKPMKRVLFDSKDVHLWPTSKDASKTLKKGLHRWAFEFQLPDTLYQSTHNRVYHVSYTFKYVYLHYHFILMIFPPMQAKKIKIKIKIKK